MNSEMVIVTATLLVLAVLTRTWTVRRGRVKRRAAVLRTDSAGHAEVVANVTTSVTSHGDAADPPWVTCGHSDPYATMPIPVVPPSPGTVHRPMDASEDDHPHVRVAPYVTTRPADARPR